MFFYDYVDHLKTDPGWHLDYAYLNKSDGGTMYTYHKEIEVNMDTPAVVPAVPQFTCTCPPPPAPIECPKYVPGFHVTWEDMAPVAMTLGALLCLGMILAWWLGLVEWVQNVFKDWEMQRNMKRDTYQREMNRSAEQRLEAEARKLEVEPRKM